MSQPNHISFMGTSRSGLGHLRWIANIAGKLARRAPDARLSLLTNAAPVALSPSEIACFSQITHREKSDMSAVLVKTKVTLAVADTMALPGIGACRGKSALILRETPRIGWTGFAAMMVVRGIAGSCRMWPRIGCPPLAPDFARRVAAAGWILRPTGVRRSDETWMGIVLATGGGGTPQTTMINTETLAMGLPDYDLARLYGRLWQAEVEGLLPCAPVKAASTVVRSAAGPDFNWCLGVVATRLAKYHAQRPAPGTSQTIMAI